MAMSEQESKNLWQETWRDLPPEERGSSRAAFAFITEYGRDLPTEWDGQSGDPWSTIAQWLREADEADGIEWQSE
ncbi:MAG: hypothetical protein R3225_01690 [Halofilum sp. (in: g-proteobacteria)]|nr:hypothetical protein [Halofilum sp. (in: g-proteobacteria)]